MRAVFILLMTSGATVISTWLSFKMHFGLIGAWIVASAILLVGQGLIANDRRRF